MASSATARGNFFTDFLDVVGDFRDEDDIGGSGEPRMQRDESSMTSHHFQHDHAVVTLGGSVQLVDCLERGVDRRVEPECGDGSAHVVIDSLRHADDPHSTVTQLVGDAHRAIAADRNECIDSQLARVLYQLVGAVLLDAAPIWQINRIAEWITAVGGAKDGSTEVSDAAYRGGRHRNDFLFAEQSGRE